MLTHVVLDADVPYTLHLDTVDPDELIVCKSISGLDAADITLFTGEFARNGGYYQGRRVGKRNPVFSLKLNPDYAADVSLSDIREKIYQMFLEPGLNRDALRVILYDDRRPPRYFIGYTEKPEMDMWSKDTVMQVSMICVDSFLQSLAVTSAYDPNGYLSTTINYEGSAKTGILMHLETQTVTSSIKVEINGAGLELRRDNNVPFASGDIISINTREGVRAVKVNGIDEMAALTAPSKWLQLRNGPNAVKVGGTDLLDGKVSMSDYQYRAEWWGV